MKRWWSTTIAIAMPRKPFSAPILESTKPAFDGSCIRNPPQNPAFAIAEHCLSKPQGPSAAKYLRARGGPCLHGSHGSPAESRMASGGGAAAGQYVHCNAVKNGAQGLAVDRKNCKREQRNPAWGS